MPHFVNAKRSDQIIKSETDKHIALDTLLFKHGSVFRIPQLRDPFDNFRRAPIRNIELVTPEGAAAHVLAVQKDVNFNGSRPSAFELNL